jgi:hypothetical protein
MARCPRCGSDATAALTRCPACGFDLPSATQGLEGPDYRPSGSRDQAPVAVMVQLPQDVHDWAPGRLPAPALHKRSAVKPFVQVEVYMSEQSIAVNGCLLRGPWVLAFGVMLGVVLIVLLAVEASRGLGLALLFIMLVLPCVGVISGQIQVVCAEARVQDGSEHGSPGPSRPPHAERTRFPLIAAAARAGSLAGFFHHLRQKENALRQRQDQAQERDRELAEQQAELEQRRAAQEACNRAEQEAQAEERRRIEARERKLAQKEWEAGTTICVPAYWKHKTGFHRVPSSFVTHALQTFMETSTCCSGFKAQVARVERIENDVLWRKYQTMRAILREEVGASSLRKLSGKTRWGLLSLYTDILACKFLLLGFLTEPADTLAIKHQVAARHPQRFRAEC